MGYRNKISHSFSDESTKKQAGLTFTMLLKKKMEIDLFRFLRTLWSKLVFTSFFQIGIFVYFLFYWEQKTKRSSQPLLQMLTKDTATKILQTTTRI